MAGRAAIVIFGAAVRPDGQPSRTLRLRTEAAARFGAGLVAAGLEHPLYVPTGGVGRFGPAEAEVMAGLLRAAGVVEADILLEDTATNTIGSVRAARRLLAGWRGPVFAASSAYHLPRCVALLRLAGFAAHAVPPPPIPAARSFQRRWFWRLREAAALPVDVVLLVWLRLTGRL